MQIHLTRKKKKILYVIASTFLVLATAVWIFIAFFLDDILNDLLRAKLNEAVRTASGGRYRLAVDRFYYHNGSIFCKEFDLFRARYDTSESGMTIERLTVDTVRFDDVQWWDLLHGDGLFMTRMEMNSPKLVLTGVASARDSLAKLHPDTAAISATLPERLSVISLDSIILNDVHVLMPGRSSKSGSATFRGVSVRLSDFILSNKNLKEKPLLFSKSIAVVIREGRYDFSDSVYSLGVRNLRCNVSDSVVLIDTITFTPNYSEEAFAAKHQYIRGRIDFHCAGIRIEGMNAVSLLEGKSIQFRKCAARNWKVDYYSDKRKPRNPRPPAAILPNDIVRSFPLRFDIDSLLLNDGRIRIRERSPLSSETGVLYFDQARLVAHPLATDSMSPYYGMPTRIAMSGLFLGEAPVTATAVYSLQQKDLNVSIAASVGKLRLKKLNSFLIPNERKEVTDGMLEDGDMRMEIRSGVATTSVTPHYRDLSMKILADNNKRKPGIIEGIKTFVANTFILRTTNINTAERKAKSSTTTRSRKKEEEFLQFIWIALRSSLGKIIGGFE